MQNFLRFVHFHCIITLSIYIYDLSYVLCNSLYVCVCILLLDDDARPYSLLEKGDFISSPIARAGEYPKK